MAQIVQSSVSDKSAQFTVIPYTTKKAYLKMILCNQNYWNIEAAGRNIVRLFIIKKRWFYIFFLEICELQTKFFIADY